MDSKTTRDQMTGMSRRLKCPDLLSKTKLKVKRDDIIKM